MSALPSAVKKQVARANELAMKSLEAAQGAPANEEASGQPAASAAPASSEPPKEQAAAAPAQSADPAPAPASDPEQRYKVLQGKYNAEVPRLQNQVRDLISSNRTLQDQLVATQQLLASLGQQRASAPAEPAAGAQPAAPLKLVKDDEVRTFGADLIDVMRRVAQETLLPDIDARIDRRMQPVAQRADQAATAASRAVSKVEKSDLQKLEEMLDSQVPNWGELNEDEGFLHWLDQTDPFSGAKRAELLSQAYQRHDGPRVVAFFKGYLNENATVNPSSQSAPAAKGQAPAPQKQLADMVAPGTPKAGTAGAQEGAGKRIWTAADIKGFYRDLQTGVYRGKVEAAKKIEADIFAAQREGRIRP